MSQLEACPRCERHVKIDEPACPFCTCSLVEAFASLPRRLMPRARLGRAATFAFGVGVTMAQGACFEPPRRDPRIDAASVPPDATPDAGTPVDADFDYDGGFPIYSAAPIDAGTPRRTG